MDFAEEIVRFPFSALRAFAVTDARAILDWDMYVSMRAQMFMVIS